MDTRSRGDIAEAAVLAALTRHGFAVWLPWSRFGSCDLLAETPTREIVRVQVKSGRVRQGCVMSNSRSTDHGNGRQSYLGLADVIAIHVEELDEQFIVDVNEFQGFEVRLRLEPTRNNQQASVRWARDFLLADWAARSTASAPVLTPP